MVFIHTVVYILTVVSSLSDNSPQHSPHYYFNVIFISVRVKFYAYVNMLCRKDLITYYFLERKAFSGKESSRCKPATKRMEETAVTAEVPLAFSPIAFLGISYLVRIEVLAHSITQ